MKAAAFFAEAERLPLASLADITRGGGLVVVAPHPDDESLGCGGLIAEACEAGTQVALVVVSDGVGSHPNSRTHPAATLRALRERETLAAAEVLGLAADRVRFLRLPDRHVPAEGPDAEIARAAIVAAARDVGAGAVCATWLHDPHCDHVATAQLVADLRDRLGAARIFFYPVWGWTLPCDSEVGAAPEGIRFDAYRHLELKHEAVAAHRSQTTGLIADDPDGFRLTPAMIAVLARRFELLLEGTRS